MNSFKFGECLLKKVFSDYLLSHELLFNMMVPTYKIALENSFKVQHKETINNVKVITVY